MNRSLYDSVKYENNPFIEIEREVIGNYFDRLDIPFIASAAKIVLSGPLADFPMQSFNPEFTPLFELHKFSPNHIHQQRIVYDVRVDANSGQIFWFHPQESSMDELQTVLAEKLLKGIHFQMNPEDFVQSGQVEITFTKGEA